MFLISFLSRSGKKKKKKPLNFEVSKNGRGKGSIARKALSFYANFCMNTMRPGVAATRKSNLHKYVLEGLEFQILKVLG